MTLLNFTVMLNKSSISEIQTVRSSVGFTDSTESLYKIFVGSKIANKLFRINFKNTAEPSSLSNCLEIQSLVSGYVCLVGRSIYDHFNILIWSSGIHYFNIITFVFDVCSEFSWTHSRQQTSSSTIWNFQFGFDSVAKKAVLWIWPGV